MLSYNERIETPTIVYAIRHGETDWNREHRLQGLSDIPLNELGRQQAKISAQKLKDHDVQVIYSSDLSRAIETASIICQEKGCTKIVRSELLRERFFGRWEGKTWDMIHQELPLSNNIDQLPEIESLAEIQRRAFTFLDQFQNEHQGTSVYLVTHGAWLEAVLKAIDLTLAKSIVIDNAACLRFIHRGKGWEWGGFLE